MLRVLPGRAPLCLVALNLASSRRVVLGRAMLGRVAFGRCVPRCAVPGRAVSARAMFCCSSPRCLEGAFSMRRGVAPVREAPVPVTSGRVASVRVLSRRAVFERSAERGSRRAGPATLFAAGAPLEIADWVSCCRCWDEVFSDCGWP
jgi:hypothetical protein